MWNIDKKEPSLHKTFYGHSKWVWDCAFSCDSEFLISCSSDGLAKIWQTESGELIRNLKQHKKTVNCLALNDIFWKSFAFKFKLLYNLIIFLHVFLYNEKYYRSIIYLRIENNKNKLFCLNLLFIEYILMD